MILRKQRDWVIHPQEQRLVEKFKILLKENGENFNSVDGDNLQILFCSKKNFHLGSQCIYRVLFMFKLHETLAIPKLDMTSGWTLIFSNLKT